MISKILLYSVHKTVPSTSADDVLGVQGDIARYERMLNPGLIIVCPKRIINYYEVPKRNTTDMLK